MDNWRAFANMVMDFPVLLNAGNLLTSCGTVSFSERAVLRDVVYET